MQAKIRTLVSGRGIFHSVAILLLLFGLVAMSSTTGGAASGLMHPMMEPGQFTEHMVCENCGMNRNMWARTRYEFQNSSGTHYTCSIHCLASFF